MLEILDPGPQSTIQDLGRRRLGHLGVPTSGAADRRSHCLANRLVGNPESSATLEVLLGGASLRFHQPACIALTGAPAPTQLGGRAFPFAEPRTVKAGDVLRIGTCTNGLRIYMAVSGGIGGPLELGSRSTDTLSGLGPAPMKAGAIVPLGRRDADCTAPQPSDAASSALCPVMLPTIRAYRGPRDEMLVPDAFARLVSASWEVTSETNRVGARLAGPPLEHAKANQSVSEGMPLGAIEVPPSGQPIVFLADHPPTGGYPVLAVVAAQDVSIIAQARPGTILRFKELRRP